MPLNSGNFLESQRSLSIDVSKQMTELEAWFMSLFTKTWTTTMDPEEMDLVLALVQAGL